MMPPPAANLHKRSAHYMEFVLLQISVIHSSLSPLKTAEYKQGQVFSYSWTGKRVKNGLKPSVCPSLGRTVT